MSILPFDIQTVILVLVVGNGALSAVILGYRGFRSLERAGAFYLSAKLCQAAGWSLIFLRGLIPDAASVLLGNLLLTSGFSLEALALGSVGGKNEDQFFFYGPIVAAGAFFLAVFGRTPSGRVVVASLANSAVYFSLAFFMLRRDRTRLRTFIGAVSAAYSFALGLRALAALQDPSFTVFSPALIQTATFFPQILFLVIGGAGFFFFVKEKDDEALRESEEKYRNVSENANEAIVIVQDERFVYANRMCGVLLGVPDPSALIGRAFDEAIWPEDRAFTKEQHLRRICGEPVDSAYEVRIVGVRGFPRWVSISASLIPWKGRSAALALITDVDERRKQRERIERLLEEKELLLREVNHRVKNNLTVAISLLSLQSGADSGASAADILRDAESRLRTMSELYETLNTRGESKFLPLKEYLGNLIDEIRVLFPRNPPIRFDLDMDGAVLDADTLSAVGLLVNEIVTNSLKHAFGAAPGASVSDPAILISARLVGDRIELRCGDNGCGLPADFRMDASSGFGMQVIAMLARQLGAQWSVDRDGGTRWRFDFAPKAISPAVDGSAPESKGA